MEKEKIVNFFARFRKLLISGGMVALAIAIVGVVAIKNNQGNYMQGSNSVSTAAPSSIIFVMPVENGEIIKDYSNTSLKYNTTLKQWESHKAIDIKVLISFPVEVLHLLLLIDKLCNQLQGNNYQYFLSQQVSYH